ncbi:MAG: hypothetical protein JXR22_12890 [Prolixibacteraceae bacterium]|nr:hypothetical protein [Prolixibacteraceae bacterium]
MTTKKQIAFEKIMTDFEEMSDLILMQLNQIDLLLDLGEKKLTEEEAAQFNNNEQKIDQLEVKLSERIVNVIALYQPVASEVRQVMAAYRIIISLERIGDYAISLLNYLESIKNLQIYDELSELLAFLFQSSVQMLRKALFAFIQQDRDSAVWVIKNDPMVDELSRKLIKKGFRKIKDFDEKKKVIASFMSIREMIDNIERIADQASNIAEAAIYYIEGKDLRHMSLLDE